MKNLIVAYKEGQNNIKKDNFKGLFNIVIFFINL